MNVNAYNVISKIKHLLFTDIVCKLILKDSIYRAYFYIAFGCRVLDRNNRLIFENNEYIHAKKQD